MPKVEIEIDGKLVETQQGAMIIEAADNAGIRIPRFCYHKKLSIAANCRMCLVEVENVRKPVPACATPISAGMKIKTASRMAIESQQAVMEFLLINHPLDCPVCDQGGECELQDVAMGYGSDVSRYTEGKRVVADKNLGPLIATDMTRCILCTRCVRFGTEVAGIRELGLIGRGDRMEISTYIERAVDSEISGNIIDLCPVGALTSKPFRFSARAWEMRQQPTIAAHDCVGSHLNVHLKGNKVKRIVPRENEAVNEVWISDRDRFSYEGLHAADRATQPLIKQDGIWQETDWSTALRLTAEKLQAIVAEHGAEAIGALASASATLEEHYLLQRVIRGLGSHNIDHRLQQVDFSDDGRAPYVTGLPLGISEIEFADSILLVGSHLRKEQPLLAHRVRKASLQGAQIMAINPVHYEFVFPLAHELTVEQGDLVLGLAGVIKAALSFIATPDEPLVHLLKDIEPTPAATAIAHQLRQSQRPLLMFGALAIQSPAFSLLKQFARVLHQATGCQWAVLTPGANSAGAYIAGCVPHQQAANVLASKPGKSTSAMLTEFLAAYVLLQVEPGFDCALSGQALKAMQQAQCVIALSSFASEAIKACADIILPIAAFTETSGTYVNVAGAWQTFNGICQPLGEARPAWKVLRVLGNLLALHGFEYVSSEEVRNEVSNLVQEQKEPTFAPKPFAYPQQLPVASQGLVRIAEVPLYATDSIVRRATALQQTPEALAAGAILINQKQADHAALSAGQQARATQGEFSVVLPVVIDERIPDGSVYIPQGVSACVGLGAPYGLVELQRA